MVRLAVDNSPAPVAGEQRRTLLAKLHIGRKALGIAEDDYRALLMRVTGQRSAKTCDGRQLAHMLAEFERMGWHSAGAPVRRAPAASPVARKARAIWISLYQLGAIEDASEKALEAFGRRQLGVDRLQWADEREGFRLIEALKAIADRHGWDHRVPSRMPAPARIRLLKDRLVGAQLARLAEAGSPVDGPLAADRDEWSSARLESAARDLADRLRQVGAA